MPPPAVASVRTPRRRRWASARVPPSNRVTRTAPDSPVPASSGI
ncbi:hypothetical protein [Kitasatospora sp. NPDC054795]